VVKRPQKMARGGLPPPLAHVWQGLTLQMQPYFANGRYCTALHWCISIVIERTSLLQR
jgi:hypothetical protein